MTAKAHFCDSLRPTGHAVSDSDDISPQDFAKAFCRVMEWASLEQHSERSPFKTMLVEHFGADPATFPVTGEMIAPYDLPNLQLALDSYLERDRVTHRLIGFGGHLGHAEMSLAGLQPAMVILEDVDLVAQERTMMGATSLLFQLLNGMDGIGVDADVIFLLTTNRADLLEPALAARPGRVDQAVEFPLPDGEARGRLIELFCTGVGARVEDRGAIVEATEGVSPAFLRELVRKATLLAASSGAAEVADEHFREALDLLERGGQITRTMLGADGGAALDGLPDDEDWDD
jgi:ATPase family associated with various cellular activities (AAA)